MSESLCRLPTFLLRCSFYTHPFKWFFPIIYWVGSPLSSRTGGMPHAKLNRADTYESRLRHHSTFLLPAAYSLENCDWWKKYLLMPVNLHSDMGALRLLKAIPLHEVLIWRVTCREKTKRWPDQLISPVGISTIFPFPHIGHALPISSYTERTFLDLQLGHTLSSLSFAGHPDLHGLTLSSLRSAANL